MEARRNWKEEEEENNQNALYEKIYFPMKMKNSENFKILKNLTNLKQQL